MGKACYGILMLLKCEGLSADLHPGVLIKTPPHDPDRKCLCRQSRSRAQA